MPIYKYAVLRSSWGIIVWIDCQILPLAALPETEQEQLISIQPRLWLDSVLGYKNTHWSEMKSSEIKFLSKGLQLIYSELMPKLGSQETVVKVTHLDFPPTDFQDEGLAYAIAGWFIENYDLPVTLPPPRFDGRYVFPFEEDE